MADLALLRQAYARKLAFKELRDDNAAFRAVREIMEREIKDQWFGADPTDEKGLAKVTAERNGWHAIARRIQVETAEISGLEVQIAEAEKAVERARRAQSRAA
jgi:hypothetical protein